MAPAPKKLGPDELLALLKAYPDLASSLPSFFTEALPIEKLEGMTGAKVKEVSYRKEQKPGLYEGLFRTDRSDSWFQVSVHIKPPSSPDDWTIRPTGFAAISDVTVIKLGDYGFVEVYRKVEYYPLPPPVPPFLSRDEFLRRTEGRVEVQFIKQGRVAVYLGSYEGLLEPEEAVEIARGFEALIE